MQNKEVIEICKATSDKNERYEIKNILLLFGLVWILRYLYVSNYFLYILLYYQLKVIEII